MKRFFLHTIKENNKTCTITGSEARHISKVMRMREGDRLILMDQTGKRFQAKIVSSVPEKVIVTLEKKLHDPPAPPVEIILCQSILKSRAMDFVVQKTSELGIGTIIPFSSERTVVRLKGDKISKKIRHWLEIAHESTKQADRFVPAEIVPPKDFQALIDSMRSEQALKIILLEGEECRGIKEILRDSPDYKKIICIVGPEGGFSGDEVGIAKNAGFIAATMGRRILRAETAAIIITAVIQYELGDLGRWEL